MNSINRIIVPVNGSEADQQAIDLACQIARKNKSRVEAIYVIEVKRSLPIDAELHGEVERGESILDAAERLSHEQEIDMETSLFQARDVGAAIVDEAVQLRADVIVMGVTYKRKFGEFAMGPTATYVLKNAPCLVWVARQPGTI